MEQTTSPHWPVAASWLGWAGVLPFLGLALLALHAPWRGPALAAFVGYAAVILSFLGGVRWGRALAAGAGAGAYALAVLPSLWAWGAAALPPAWALCGLASGFAAMAWLDLLHPPGPAPDAFRRLRAGLSLAVLACHGLALAALLADR